MYERRVAPRVLVEINERAKFHSAFTSMMGCCEWNSDQVA
jgi:hypothetical protein